MAKKEAALGRPGSLLPEVATMILVCVCVCVYALVCLCLLLSHVQLFAASQTYCPWNSPDKNTGIGSHSLL